LTLRPPVTVYRVGSEPIGKESEKAENMDNYDSYVYNQS